MKTEKVMNTPANPQKNLSSNPTFLYNFLNKIDKIDYFPSFIQNGFDDMESLQI